MAFNGFSNLTSVIIPNSVTNIGANALTGGKVFSYCTSLTSVTIPNSVTTIGTDVFKNCIGLTSVTIPNSVTTIGDGAFSGCIGLTSVTIPNSVTFIDEGAFSGCIGLTSVTIPNSVTRINGSAFSGCSSLSSITVEDGNMYYDSRNNCNAIIDSNNQLIVGCKNTIIPNSVTSIGNSAFSCCSSLTSLNIPNNITFIGNWAFSGCSGLVYIVLPSKLNSIGSNAFSGCYSLTDIYCNTTNVPNANTSCFTNTENITLHVPSESLNNYKSTEPWKNFKSIVSLDNNDTQGGQRCSKPTISVVDGKFVFSCETPDVSYRWIISTPNGTNGTTYSYNSNIQSVTLSVFATKFGYQNSDVATYTFPSLAGDVDGNGVVNVADHVELSRIIMGQ